MVAKQKYNQWKNYKKIMITAFSIVITESLSNRICGVAVNAETKITFS